MTTTGGGAAVPSDIFHGGLFDYNDLASASVPIPVTVAGSPVILTNDGLGPQTNKVFPPNGVTDVWNASLNVFDWSQLKFGDMVDIRLALEVITTFVNTEVEVSLHLGTGAGSYTIPFITDTNLKVATSHPLNRFNGIYIGDANTLDNGGVFKITTDRDCAVTVVGWYCKIIGRG